MWGGPICFWVALSLATDHRHTERQTDCLGLFGPRGLNSQGCVRRKTRARPVACRSTIISELFRGHQKMSITCEAGHESSRDEAFLDLHVTMSTLQQGKKRKRGKVRAKITA